ncbi:hypothetical protein RF11_02508 [Thelohanellus kitauei]|uniref:Uncharacterized protein n=1 Tax=Thelohanellus kitauei TaxID=669202 RepID=A0A0C2IAL5_THEKT|nr:hypothetical protein RF11_02508 [Thelohanellus kitauei]
MEVRMYWLFVIRFILLNPNFGKLLTQRYPIYPKIGKDSESFIFLLKSIWSSLHFIDKQIEIPIVIFKNILLSCFQSLESAEKFIHDDINIFDNKPNHNERVIDMINDHCCIGVLNHFVMNSYEHLFFDTIFKNKNTNLSNNMIDDALECLIMMTAHEDFAYLISNMNEIHRKLCCKVFQEYCTTFSAKSCYKVYKYAKRLIVKSVCYKLKTNTSLLIGMKSKLIKYILNIYSIT